jgi:transposase
MSLSVEQRIVELHAQGYNRDAICSTLQTGEHRVSRTLKIFHETGTIPTPRVGGRPRKVTDDILDFIDVRTIQTASLSSGWLAKEVQQRFGVQLSKSTITGARGNLGFHFRPPRHCQRLRPEHIAARVAFCQEQLDQPQYLPLIHFSDESRFVLGDDKRWIWYRRGEENESAFATKQKFPPSLMIFAVIGVGYKSRLLFVHGNINAAKYIENLDRLGFIEELDAKHGALGWIFQQDGAPCHTAQEAIDWIEENCDLLSGWPANSPDLNPIEMLWAILKEAVARLEPKSIEELQNVLLTVWNGISQAVVDKLCWSFARRLQMCLMTEGRAIGHLLGLCGQEEVEQIWNSWTDQDSGWTLAEDRLLYSCVRCIGNKWKKFQQVRFPNRSRAALKLHWESMQWREERKIG